MLSSTQRRTRHERQEEISTIWKEWPHLPITITVQLVLLPLNSVIRERTQCAIISRVFASWTCPVKLHATDTANIIFWHVPMPCRHGIPLLDRDLHPSIAKPSGVKEAGSRMTVVCPDRATFLGRSGSLLISVDIGDLLPAEPAQKVRLGLNVGRTRGCDQQRRLLVLAFSLYYHIGLLTFRKPHLSSGFRG